MEKEVKLIILETSREFGKWDEIGEVYLPRSVALGLEADTHIIVPKEPTEEILRAMDVAIGTNHFTDDGRVCFDRSDLVAIYKAMIKE